MLKKQKRESEKRQLMNLSNQRARTVGAPDYGVKEGDVLVLKQTVAQLVSANNNHHQLLEEFEKNIKEKSVHAYYMGQVILKILVDKGLTTAEEIDKLTRQIQLNENNLSSKGPGTVAESGDTILISFTIYDQKGEIVDDRSKEIMAYVLGTGGLPCDDQLIGIGRGESRHLTVVFGPGFVHKHLTGQELLLHVTCHDIQVVRTQAAS